MVLQLLAINSFSFESANILKETLKRLFDVDSNVQSDRNCPRISISKNESKEIFLNIVSPYFEVIPTMKYKISGNLFYRNATKISG